jgi:hypothetical protein
VILNPRLFTVLISTTALLALVSCSPYSSSLVSDLQKNLENEGSVGFTNGVVKVTAEFPVQVGSNGEVESAARIENPVTIVNPSAVTFSLNAASILSPAISNSMLDFGKLGIGELFDNSLNVCGTTGKKKCTKAYIQIYTIGKPGAGMWNAEGAYGMPIYANQVGSPRLVVGLGAPSAAVLQTIPIPANKNVLRLSDFPVAPSYELRTDFTQAGAGTYTTNVVVEYGLLE